MFVKEILLGLGGVTEAEIVSLFMAVLSKLCAAYSEGPPRESSRCSAASGKATPLWFKLSDPGLNRWQCTDNVC